MTIVAKARILCGLAGAVALASGLASIRVGGRDPVPAGGAGTARWEPAVRAPTGAASEPPAAHQWRAPAPSSRGAEWRYELFTPPAIAFDPVRRRFVVRDVKHPSDAESEEEPIGVELVAVRREPFRLQLLGYVGGEGRWKGMFQDAISGEVFLAGSGRRIPGLELEIRAVDVRSEPVALPDCMTTRQRVATAIVDDWRTGREVVLTDRERRLEGELVATVQIAGTPALRDVRAGDSLWAAGVEYRVERMETVPPRIVMIRNAGGAPPQRRTLAGRAPSAAAAKVNATSP